MQHKEGKVDVAFFVQLAEASCPCPYGWLDPKICWKTNTAGCKQSRVFVEHIVDNFLTQGVKELTKEDTLLEVILTKNWSGKLNLEAALAKVTMEW